MNQIREKTSHACGALGRAVKRNATGITGESVEAVTQKMNSAIHEGVAES